MEGIMDKPQIIIIKEKLCDHKNVKMNYVWNWKIIINKRIALFQFQ